MKRWRTPTAKPGEIKIAYGKVDRHSNPDLCVAWGEGVDLIMHAITEKRLHAKFPGPGHEYEPSLLEELDARGFDITTLKLSIQRKQA